MTYSQKICKALESTLKDNLTTTNKRACRFEFWTFIGCKFILDLAVTFVLYRGLDFTNPAEFQQIFSTFGYNLYVALSLVLLVPFSTLLIRRFNDLGYSANIAIAYLVFYIYTYISSILIAKGLASFSIGYLSALSTLSGLVIYIVCSFEGEDEENEFGPPATENLQV